MDWVKHGLKGEEVSHPFLFYRARDELCTQHTAWRYTKSKLQSLLMNVLDLAACRWRKENSGTSHPGFQSLLCHFPAVMDPHHLLTPFPVFSPVNHTKPLGLFSELAITIDTTLSSLCPPSHLILPKALRGKNEDFSHSKMMRLKLREAFCVF